MNCFVGSKGPVVQAVYSLSCIPVAFCAFVFGGPGGGRKVVPGCCVLVSFALARPSRAESWYFVAAGKSEVVC
jgi:hypothetical protein